MNLNNHSSLIPHPSSFLHALFFNHRNKPVYFHKTKVFAAPLPDGNTFTFHLLVPDNKHIWDLLHLSLSDLVAYLLVPLVYLCPYPGLPKFFKDAVSIRNMLVGYGHHHGLNRCKPGRKCPGIMLNEYPKKPFKGTHKRPVNHYRPVPLAVLAYIVHIKLLREIEVHLDSRTLPGASNGILYLQVYLWAVKGPASLIHLV